MDRYLLFTLYLVIGLSSCVSLKDASSERRFESSNFSEINGTYIVEADSFCSLSLIDFLKIDYFLTNQRLYSETEDTLELKIEALSEKKIRIDVLSNDSIEASYKVKGKLKENYFVLKKQRRFECEFLCLFPCINRQKTRLRLDEKGGIIIDSESKITCFILFYPQFTHRFRYYEEVFKRKL